ncbi:hypothetical protein BDV06DRAFT_221703 [Aspergillus oleicola]
MRFCCSKGDNDGDERPARPTRAPEKAKGKYDTNTATPPSTNTGVTPAEETPAEDTPGKMPDLWKEAYDGLDEGLKKYVSSGDTDSATDAINVVIEQTRHKYREWKEGGLKIPRKDGKDIDFRGSMEKILNAALQVQDLIANVAAFDPTGKASAAWYVVSLGMTMVSNDIQRRNEMFGASEYLSETLAYYSIIDAHYRDQEVAGGQNFDQALLRVYTAILEYTAEVKKAQQENALERVVKSIMAISDQRFTKLKEAISEQSLNAEKWSNLTNNIRTREIAQSSLAAIDENLEITKKVYSKVLDEEEQRVMAWVSDLDCSGIQSTTQGHRTADTGNWLLELQEYKDWKSSPGGILWLPGVVGCGKSVLCSTVIQDIEHLCEEDESKVLAYWYFQFSHEETQNVDNMIRSLIRQLSRSPLDESVRKAWERFGKKGKQPSRENLVAILSGIVSSLPSDVFVIFDALDECPQTTSSKERERLLPLLVDLAERSENIHILATSRPEQDISETMAKFPTVDLEERLAKDVEIFVRTALDRGGLNDLDANMKSAVIDTLLNSGERRFRWTDLQIKRLEDCADNEEVQKALRTIPKTLEDTYKTILDKIEQDHGSKARVMLMLLAFAPCSLDLKTVASSVPLRSPKFVRNICTSYLLSVSDENKVRLAHFSVKEYLVVSKDSDTGHGCRFSEQAAHETLARRTIELLLEQTTALTEEAVMEKPFLVYSAIHWSSHIDALGDISLWPEDLPAKVNRLFTERTVYFNWWRIAESATHGEDNPWNKVPEECKPPLHRAAEMSLLPIVDTLIDQGADPLDSRGGCKSPFEQAFFRGRLDVVELMLKKNLPITQDMVGTLLAMISLTDGKHAGDASLSKLQAIMNTMRDLGLLCDPSQSTPQVIPARLIRRAMTNSTTGPQITKQFLDWRDRGLVSFSLPDDAVGAVTFLTPLTDEMLDLLFTRCSSEVHVPPDISTDITFLDVFADGVAALVRRALADLTMSDALVGVMVKKFDSKTLEPILQARPDIRVTERVLVKAGNNSADVIQLLWTRREQGTSITENLLVSAAASRKSKEFLEFLIDQLEPGTRLTDKVMSEVIGNNPCGISMVKMIWETQKATFNVSEGLIETAISRFQTPLEMVQLLMNNNMSQIPITEAMMRAAARNYHHASSLIAFLSQGKEQSTLASEDVLIAAMQSKPDAVETLLEKFPSIPITDRSFIKAYHQPVMMRLLLDKHTGRPPIDKIINLLKADCAKNKQPKAEILSALLDRQLVHADGKLLESLAGDYGILSILINRLPNVPISQETLVRAAKDPRSIRLLLQRRGSEVCVTENVIIGATESFDPWKFREVIEAIIYRTGSVPITKKVFQAALTHHAHEAIPWLAEQRPDLAININEIFDSVWQDNDTPILDKVIAFDALVESQGNIRLTPLMLERYRIEIENRDTWRGKESEEDDSDEDEWSFDTFVGIITEAGSEISISESERVAEIIVEKCSHETVKDFLESRSDITITDTLVQAVERNVVADPEALRSLLAERQSN